MNARRTRFALNVILGLLLIVLMPYGNLPEWFHETSGVAFFVLAIAHLVLNRGWFKSLVKGKWTALKVWRSTTNLLLVATFVAQIVSGVAISVCLFVRVPEFMDAEIARRAHLALGSWTLLLAGLHLGAHWLSLARALSKRRTTRAIVAILFATTAIIGARNFYSRGAFGYLRFSSSFPFFDYDESVLSALFGYFSIFTLYAVGGAFATAIFQRVSRATTTIEADDARDD